MNDLEGKVIKDAVYSEKYGYFKIVCKDGTTLVFAAGCHPGADPHLVVDIEQPGPEPLGVGGSAEEPK
jgi:hypothetical protein